MSSAEQHKSGTQPPSSKEGGKSTIQRLSRLGEQILKRGADIIRSRPHAKSCRERAVTPHHKKDQPGESYDGDDEQESEDNNYSNERPAAPAAPSFKVLPRTPPRSSGPPPSNLQSRYRPSSNRPSSNRPPDNCLPSSSHLSRSRPLRYHPARYHPSTRRHRSLPPKIPLKMASDPYLTKRSSLGLTVRNAPPENNNSTPSALSELVAQSVPDSPESPYSPRRYPHFQASQNDSPNPHSAEHATLYGTHSIWQQQTIVDNSSSFEMPTGRSNDTRAAYAQPPTTAAHVPKPRVTIDRWGSAYRGGLQQQQNRARIPPPSQADQAYQSFKPPPQNSYASPYTLPTRPACPWNASIQQQPLYQPTRWVAPGPKPLTRATNRWTSSPLADGPPSIASPKPLRLMNGRSGKDWVAMLQEKAEAMERDQDEYNKTFQALSLDREYDSMDGIIDEEDKEDKEASAKLTMG